MVSIRTSYLKWDFSAFLVAVLLKVSTIADAVPLPDICNLKGLTINGVDISNLDIPRLLFEAADTPKKSTAEKIKEVGDEVVEKIHEFYGLLAESQSIREDEEETRPVDADNMDYLSTREIGQGEVGQGEDVEVDPVRALIADEVRRKALNPTLSRSKSAADKTTDEVEPESGQIASVESDFEKLESDKLVSEAESADLKVPSESADLVNASKPNAGDKIKQTAQEVAQKVQQFVNDSFRNPDGQLKIKAAGDRMRKNANHLSRKMKQFYDERIKRAGDISIDPETGAPIPGKPRKTIGEKIKDAIKNPINKFLDFKLQLMVHVKPLA